MAQILNIFENHFENTEKALEYLIQRGIIVLEERCEKCGSTMVLKRDDRWFLARYWSCRRPCRKKIKFLQNNYFGKIKIDLNIHLRALMCFIMDFDTAQTLSVTGLAPATNVKIKKLALSKFVEFSELTHTKIGGPGRVLQIDETVVCRGRIILNPTSSHDNIPGSQWMIGIIDSESQEFFITLIPNRRIISINQFLNDNVLPGSIIVSDGHPSYPEAIRRHGSEHRVVIHDVEYVNQDGFHTNNIENLWFHFKRMYRSRNGLQAQCMKLFIYEFLMKHKYLKERNTESFLRTFEFLINIIR